MKLIDAEKLKNWIKRECNPYGAPTLDFETSEKIMDMIDRMDNENRWILVSERVPETATPVLCSVESTDISEARIHIIGSYHNDCWFLQSSVGLHSQIRQLERQSGQLAGCRHISTMPFVS